MNQIRKFRETAKLTQVELAKQVGVSQAAISDAERGAIPKLGTMRSIVKALNEAGVECSLDDVFPPEGVAA